jgi:hypothetical protein
VSIFFAIACFLAERGFVPSVGLGEIADTKVKPEAATAVIELLMMGGKTPETC